MASSKFRWISIDNAINPPKVAHLLGHYDIWVMTDGKGNILIYGNRPGSVQGNSHKSIAERLMKDPQYQELGVVGLIFMKQLFLPDSPGNY